jgi:hypothetical protein
MPSGRRILMMTRPPPEKKVKKERDFSRGISYFSNAKKARSPVGLVGSRSTLFSSQKAVTVERSICFGFVMLIS